MGIQIRFYASPLVLDRRHTHTGEGNQGTPHQQREKLTRVGLAALLQVGGSWKGWALDK